MYCMEKLAVNKYIAAVAKREKKRRSKIRLKGGSGKRVEIT